MPAAARDELERQLRAYRRQHPDVRWTSPESWHLTLLFLGSVLTDRVPRLRELIDEVAAQAEPYAVHLAKGGGRDRHGEGVAWLALDVGAGRLIELASRVALACPPGIMSGPPPRRTPAAHLTVARRADSAVIDALRRAPHGPLGVGWTVEDLELVRSHLGPAGARYETVHRAAL